MHVSPYAVQYISAVQFGESAVRRRSPHVDPKATGVVQVTIFTQVPLAGQPYASPDALYEAKSSALATSVADGAYNELLRSNAQTDAASQLTSAEATGAVSSAPTVDAIPDTFAPTLLPTAAPPPFSGQLAVEVSSTFPGLAMILVVVAVLYFRRKRAHTLNEMRTRFGGEYVDVGVRGLTVVLAVNVLLTQSFGSHNRQFVLLLLSRLLILAQSAFCFAIFVCPARNELTRTSLSVLLNTDALQDGGANTMYSCVVIASVFDTSMLRYLPWHRTTFTRVMDGYPNMLLLRCSVYGTFLSSLLQTVALFPSMQGGSTAATGKAIALLIVSVLNLVRSFVSIVLSMKRASSTEFKMAIVSEKDVAALADFIHSSAGSESSRTTEAMRGVRERHSSFTPDKVSEMLSFVRGSRPTSMRSNRAEQDNPLHQHSVAEDGVDLSVRAAESRDADSMMDERGIRFSTKINFADETVGIMREQMISAGLKPLEFIPLQELKAELATLFEKANSGIPYDTDRLDYLLLCLDHNPEHKKEQVALHKVWLAEVTPVLQESLDTMRSFVPPHIFKCSEAELEGEGYAKALAKRIMTKKCLWLVRVSTADIDRMHVVELSGRFNPEAQNLDLIETAAIYAVLPERFGNDADRRKARWRASVEQNLKAMYAQSKAGTLPGPKKRNPAYKNQLPRFEGRETLHEMSGVSKSNAYAPRTSFLTLAHTDPATPGGDNAQSGAGTGADSPAVAEGSIAKRTATLLSRTLPTFPSKGAPGTDR
jgi:hypothetical protein